MGLAAFEWNYASSETFPPSKVFSFPICSEGCDMGGNAFHHHQGVVAVGSSIWIRRILKMVDDK